MPSVAYNWYPNLIRIVIEFINSNLNLSSPIEILEFCLRDKQYNPMNSILTESVQCVKDTIVILTYYLGRTYQIRWNYQSYIKFTKKLSRRLLIELRL